MGIIDHLMSTSRRHFGPCVLVVLGLGIFLAMALRFSLFDFTSMDYQIFLRPWYEFIVSYGGLGALGYDFSNYSPLYLYFLTLAT